jgi:hypothetical protein
VLLVCEGAAWLAPRQFQPPSRSKEEESREQTAPVRHLHGPGLLYGRGLVRRLTARRSHRDHIIRRRIDDALHLVRYRLQGLVD